MSIADDLLKELTLQQALPPMSQEAAQNVAEDWRGTATANDVDPQALDAAAGGDLVGYIQRIFGNAEELEV